MVVVWRFRREKRVVVRCDIEEEARSRREEDSCWLAGSQRGGMVGEVVGCCEDARWFWKKALRLS